MAGFFALLLAGLLAQGMAAGTANAATQDVTAGSHHTCALNSAGGVLCWGRWALGNGSAGEQHTPTPVSGLSSGVASIAAGSNHTCAVTDVGAAWCWGDDSHGQLGDGNPPGAGGEKLVPVAVRGLDSGVSAIYAGVDYSCALTRHGQVFCWGRNDQGQLGLGDRIDRAVPTPVLGLGIPSGVVGMALGRHYTCALKLAGDHLWCWGSQPWINNTRWNHDTPQSVAEGVKGVTVSGHRLCLLSRTDQMMCFDDQTESGKPRMVQNPPGYVPNGVFSGPESLHSCEVTQAGQLLCWGGNSDGQLGNQSAADSPALPVQPLGLNSGVVAVAVGDAHSCAATKAGAVYCWGAGAHGETGTGNAASGSPQPSELAPVQTLGEGGKGFLSLGVSPLRVGSSAQAKYSNVGDYAVGKDSAVAVAGACIGTYRTAGGRLVIVCRNSQYSPTSWLVLFPPAATDRTVQEESNFRHAAIEHELGLDRPTRDFPPLALAGTSGPSATITHSAVYQTRMGSLDVQTYTRLSPEGRAFFGVYASFDSNKFLEGLPVAAEQFADWHSVAAAALPTDRRNQTAGNEWGPIAETLAQLYNSAPQGVTDLEQGTAQSTKEFLPQLVGNWSGKSKATIHAYSGFGSVGDVMTVATDTVNEGPATLRIRPDGTYTMHSDWEFSGCRIIRDHDGTLALVGSPKPQGVRLLPAHFVEHAEKTKSWVSSCKEGTRTQAPAMQFGLIWSGNGPTASLIMTRHEDGDSQNTRHEMTFARQAGK